MSTAGADFDALLNFVLPFAKQTLRRYGSLAPLGAAMRASGEIEAIGADPGPGPDSTVSVRAIEVLKNGMIANARAGAFRATVILYESVFKLDPNRPRDAITALLDHRDGLSEIMFFCFTLGPPATGKRERKFIDGEVFEMDGKREVFPVR